MADWYVSSVDFAAVSAWTASTTESVGNFVKATSPATNEDFVFRCSAITTGITGSTQPTWPTTNNGTVTDGGVTWTNVTGQSTYGWSAAAGTLGAILGATATARTSAGDRVFLANTHAETGTSVSNQFVNCNGTAASPVKVTSVNRANNNIPPLSTDYDAGASISFATGTVAFDCMIIFAGVTFNFNGIVYWSSSVSPSIYFSGCSLVQTGTSSADNFESNNPAKITLDNTTVTFGATSQGFACVGGYAYDLVWKNTPSAIGGSTYPSVLFYNAGSGDMTVTCKGVDFSALGSSNSFISIANTVPVKVSLANCKISSSAQIVTGTPSSAAGAGCSGTLEMVNCDSGATNYRCERHTRSGNVTTDTSTTLSGGASNGTTSFSRKMVSNAYCSYATPLEGFSIDVWNTLVGASHTVTVQVISSSTLTNAQLFAEVEYLGDSGDCRSEIISTYPANAMTSATNLTSSSSSWNNPPSTPQTQEIQVTFTPEQAGLVRVVLKLAAASTTVWYDPTATIV